MIRRIIFVIFLLTSSLSGAAQEHIAVFYNVENMFDTINCPTTADEDMLPLADRRWDGERYRTKINNIADILACISTHNYPALIGLAEVENRAVLKELTATSALSAANYKICHYDSPDSRGIDVALLYRNDIFHIEGSQAIASTIGHPTRDILTAWGTINNEKIFIAVVHWPSRIGGVKFTEPRRIACAKQLRGITDSIRQSNPATKIIIMGDMNDNPRNRSISTHLGVRRKAKRLSPNDLYTPFANTRRGSSVYNGRWNRYDNIVVSANLLHGQGLQLQPVAGKRLGSVYSRRDMLDKHGHPQPTFKGVEYTGGASDHLPVYVILGR